jgi:lipopolysaccharide transport system ATP-binding protein
MSESAISLVGVSKSFRKQAVRREYTTLKSEFVRWLKRENVPDNPSTVLPVLKDVDLEIPRGRTVGLVGRNGSGKSTLLKLMTGIYSPTRGKVSVRGRVSALLDLGAGFHPDFTGRENIFINAIILGMSRAEVKERVDDIIAFSELGDFIDQPVRTYSSGMFMRLAFSVATHVEPEILIVDEILAVGDAHFNKKSLARMKEFKASGRTIVLVTHDLNTVQEWCDHAVWIDGGRVREQGNPSDIVKDYRAAIQLAEAQSEATGTSALSAPGLPLPELPAAPAPRASVESLQLVGAAPGEVTPGGSAVVSAEVQIREGCGPAVLATSVLREGQLVSESRAPADWTGRARVSWEVNPVTLLPGTYGLRVSVHAGAETLASAELAGGWRVTGAPIPGVVALPGAWRIEPEAREKAG